MSPSLTKSLRLSPSLKMEEDAKAIEKQGIVSILGSDCERTKAAMSLRRTLSADMSSKKWLAHHGFYPMKKIASSEEFPVTVLDSSSSSEEEEEYYEDKKELERPSQFDVWSSIQSEQKKKELEKPAQFDVWSSILSQKPDHDSSKCNPLPTTTPYIHPLVKRASSLSEKSLEVCTESLGSETGSDRFSSHPPSETGDVEEDKEEVQGQSQPYDKEEVQVMKFNCYVTKTTSQLPRSFPPPLPSLSRGDGPSLHMRSRRTNGRLVLEAVSVPSQNFFRAQRQDGRLVLTFVNSPRSLESSDDDGEKMIEEEEDDKVDAYETEADHEVENLEEDDEENGAKEMGSIVMEQAPKLPSGVINVHRSALMMKKLMGLANRNPTWPHHKMINKVVNLEDEEEEEPTPLTQSLPPPPRVARLIPSPPSAASSCFNAYEYCWRTKPTAAATILKPLTQQPPPLVNNSDNKFILSKSPKAHEQQQLFVLRGNSLSRGCKEPRRSLLIWEPCYIATS